VRAELPGALARETAAQEAEGATVVCLAVDGALAGVLVLADRVRPDAADAVLALGRMGCEVVMFTGDARGTAMAVAARVGIGRVEARMSPMGKAEAVAAMRAAGRRVVMVGDGVNDAPALVEADVGIAMGRATDVALESADMVLVRDRLMLVPDALRLARRTLSVIRLNVFWAFFYNVVTIPLAITGVLHPIVAAIAMAASSVSVVLNSLRARIR
jgi:P-type E1-E2 ATPase